jgi:hypothetical protein
MEVSVMMAPKTSKSQVGEDFCCGWGNCHYMFFGQAHPKHELNWAELALVVRLN